MKIFKSWKTFINDDYTYKTETVKKIIGHDEIKIGKDIFEISNYGGDGFITGKCYCYYENKNNADEVIRVDYTLKKVGKDSYKDVDEILDFTYWHSYEAGEC